VEQRVTSGLTVMNGFGCSGFIDCVAVQRYTGVAFASRVQHRKVFSETTLKSILTHRHRSPRGVAGFRSLGGTEIFFSYL